MGYIITHRLERRMNGAMVWVVEWSEGDVIFIRAEGETLASAHGAARILYRIYEDACPEQYSQIDRTNVPG